MSFKIGIFDSGHGGLDLLQHLATRHIDWTFKYVADLGFMPYGNKSPELIVERCLKISQILIDQGCDAIIVACNTATAVAIETMRDRFSLPIIGIEPYLNYINKAPAKEFNNGELGALVTANTGQSLRFKKLKELRDPLGLVKVEIIEALAPLVEQLIANKDLNDFKEKLRAILSPVSQHGWKEVILGCTHYPLISEFISTELGVSCISPTQYVALQLESRLGQLIGVEQPSNYRDCTFDYLNTHSGNQTQWSEQKMSDFLFWRYS